MLSQVKKRTIGVKGTSLQHPSNPRHPQDSRRRLLALVEDVPRLSGRALSKSPLSYPRLTRPGEEHENVGQRDVDIAIMKDELEDELEAEMNVRFQSENSSSFPIQLLFESIRKAASKPEFGRTTIDEWRKILVFGEHRVKRNSAKKRFDWVYPSTKTYSEGIPINASREVANDWFVNYFIPSLLDNKVQQHSLAAVGAPGCGKSTLFKYLLSGNADEIQRSRIVFSRFEFLKFWWRWRAARPSLEEALKDYLSFIHSRDLFLAHFFRMVDGCRFELKFQFQREDKVNEELDRLEQEVHKLGPMIGVPTTNIIKFLVTQTFSKAKLGNSELIEWLSEVPTLQRILLVGVLWPENGQLVTIFDGLDSLRIEDAFQDSPEWKAVTHIIKNRRHLSAPTSLHDLGIARRSDSIVVMRNNTAAVMDAKHAGTESPLGFREYFHLTNVDGLSAMVSVVERATERVDELRALNERERAEFTFSIMKVIQRTFFSIWRGQGASVPSNLIYDFFDGNLRELFYFVSRIVLWTVKQMLRRSYLDSDEYINASIRKLVMAISSERGTDFLLRKSYRIVELLLFKRGNWFENQAYIIKTDDPMMEELGVKKRIVGNRKFSGDIDNIFNYTNDETVDEFDSHCLLEKIRIVQLCETEPLTFTELRGRMERELGFIVPELQLLLRFLLKTDFIAARVQKRRHGVEFRFSATARGRLCVASLISNLSYVEHVFHRTLLPEVLTHCVNDLPRYQHTLQWAAHSVRNAFILLAYFRALEEHRANGKAVPSQFHLFPELKKKLLRSLERMTRPGAPPQGALEQSNQSQVDAAWICKTAVNEIEAVLRDWEDRDLIRR